ncbi:hypothetical protein [Cupriavidus sp. SW-Y-13]|uniref:hypothetical protein n=1 Tax=Cupriavidus sp. SW-Y-13 TaxID=2653854 RepID=UPI00139C1B4F|nr:hypothetical protein [Cupriavidus sp. SW-Y-13]MWL91322.1 hypothetical protein [Cupriavidus sp. SW-Y-13]
MPVIEDLTAPLDKEWPLLDLHKFIGKAIDGLPDHGQPCLWLRTGKLVLCSTPTSKQQRFAT